MEAIMALTVSELIARIAILAATVTGILQFLPVKINPWSWLAKRVGRSINKELMDQFEMIDRKVDKLETNMERAAATNNRTKIIRFASEIRLRQKHSKDYFDEVMGAITEYDQYCEDHPDFKNSITQASSKLIEETYHECLRDNTFL